MGWGKYFLPACGFVMRIIPNTQADAVELKKLVEEAAENKIQLTLEAKAAGHLLEKI